TAASGELSSAAIRLVRRCRLCSTPPPPAKVKLPERHLRHKLSPEIAIGIEPIMRTTNQSQILLLMRSTAGKWYPMVDLQLVPTITALAVRSDVATASTVPLINL